MVSLSVIFGFDYETWDASGAFLKGMTFQELTQRLKAQGQESLKRQVFIVPPRDVWTKLAKLSPVYRNLDRPAEKYVLEALRPVMR